MESRGIHQGQMPVTAVRKGIGTVKEQAGNSLGSSSKKNVKGSCWTVACRPVVISGWTGRPMAT